MDIIIFTIIIVIIILIIINFPSKNKIKQEPMPNAEAPSLEKIFEIGG